VTAAPEGLHLVEHRGVEQRRAEDAGPSPTVVLVHGSLDRGATFARVVRRLDDLNVITYDRRGYNHSRDMPVARSLDEHVRDLVALVGPGPAVVIGHSYGGDVAMGAALASPDTIGAVGAYEPPLPWMDWWPRRSASSIADEDPGSFAEGFFRRVVGGGGWERLSASARAARRADGPALVAELAELRQRNPLDVDHLRVPLVLGRGENSRWHHRRAIDALVEAVPDAEVVDIRGAAHGAPLSHPDAFAALVQRVVARWRAVRDEPAGSESAHRLGSSQA
jgi:pimeloyl-ACP methyl ester carboxylesterase